MIYFVQPASGGSVKIGLTKNPEQRLRDLQVGNHERLGLLRVEEGDLEREQELHGQFGHLRLHGEWFYPTAELADYCGAIPGDPAIADLVATARQVGRWEGRIEGEEFWAARARKWTEGVLHELAWLNPDETGVSVVGPDPHLTAEHGFCSPKTIIREIAVKMCDPPFGIPAGFGVHVHQPLNCAADESVAA